MITAMLMTLAPMAVIPPSPKISAWMISAIDTERHAAQGPNKIAMSVAPTACPVVPPASGTLNIMITKENAAPRAMSGICLALSVFFTLTAATAQIGMIATSSTA